ncbi:hypothetical protein PG987_006249 [Apiospora arundinis]
MEHKSNGGGGGSSSNASTHTVVSGMVKNINEKGTDVHGNPHSPSGVGDDALLRSPALRDSELQDPNPPSNFPDGGPEAWWTVAGASACMFVSFGWINCVGIFQDYYQEHQLAAYTPSDIAWISSIQLFFMIFMGVFVGKILDDHGPAIPLIMGTFLHVFGLMLTSVSDTYEQIILCQGVLSAIGCSMIFYPAFNCVSTWFLAKRGIAMGIAVMGSSIGGVIFPVMLIHLIPKIGFGWSIRACAFLILGLLIFANFTVRSRLTPVPRPLVIKAFFTPLLELPFTLTTLAIFFFYWGMFLPLTYIVVEAIAQGMDPTLAQYLVPILNAASIIGRTVPNALADKFGHFNMMILMSGFTSLLILAVWLPAHGQSANIAFAIFYGIGSGAGIGLAPVLIHKISDLRDLGVRSGTSFSISSLAGLTGSPIAGQIIKSDHSSFKNMKVYGGISCAVGTALFIAARLAVGGIGKKKTY